DFLTYGVDPPNADLLRTLHPHRRDQRLVFVASTHTYFIDGLETLGSVTGLVHGCVRAFNADSAITSMEQSRNWPRRGYIRADIPEAIMDALLSTPGGSELVELLMQNPRDEAGICRQAHALMRQHPESRLLVMGIAMTRGNIKAEWERNRIESANRGTWMHLNFEMHLNRIPV
ncbi:MAG: hypothetical protein GY785_08295, partial [Gammaproteobacteria bacterium]|nr:hypothetical protein [Gammaproteobacteria bacterium]